DAARGGTMYISLEPCAHAGRTGPCTQALIAAGVARVVFAQADPSPLAGGGSDVLRAAGVPAEGGLLADEATALNRHWTFAVTNGRPFVTWKFAASLDGRSAAADGTSQWITSAAARADVQRLRARCGAVMVGTGTVIADDPHLTVRDDDGAPAGRQPARVVVGSRPIPPGAKVLDDAAETLVVGDPAAALEALAAREIHHVLLEGGPTLAASLLARGLVDEVVAYISPALLGAGAAAVGDFGVGSIGDILRLEVTDVTVVGGDVRITGLPGRPACSGP
ncbi:MAG: bifunctional diaminohydroxyphosphoribosylaminopyrimidine deaminase/5-amino-6-(5-phosphoribosylamino)uracil reductase RibD, partial [Actinomycetota bacterium]